MEALWSALELLATPWHYVNDPGRRIFWGALLSSLLLAAWITARRQGGFDWRAQLAALFDRRYWLHRSSAVDLALLISNGFLRALLLVPLFGSHLVVTLAVGSTLQDTLGNAPDVELPWLAIATLFTLTLFVVEDGSRFGLHALMHRVPFLWRLHRLHHSAEVLTPLTLFRVHPIEQVLYYLRGLLVVGGVGGVFLWLFQGRLSGWDILGVDALGFLFNMAGANLRHSHIWLGFGRGERLFISPAQHQLHHSVAHGHANLGTCLAVWDRLAGTWLPAAQRPADLRFGVEAEARPNAALPRLLRA
ncbi:MAG: sterol desaturase family protein [Pseudomonadota bacterium]